MKYERKSGLALIPFLVFIAVYIGAGIAYHDFYKFPSVTAMLFATVVAFIMSGESINERFATFAKGAGNVDVLTMLVIYILAGAFASVAGAVGAKDATVNLGLHLVPPSLLAAGMFMIAAFFGTATGTSMGTINLLIPVAVGVAEKGGLSPVIIIAAVVGGGMFGDNLSMISDTTIAATRSQRVEMRDKFRVNLLIALPAAIITIVLLLIFGRPETVTPVEAGSFNFFLVLPYLTVLILALCGMNVFLVLTIGIFFAIAVGLLFGVPSVSAEAAAAAAAGNPMGGGAVLANAIFNGVVGMNEVYFLTFLSSGMSELIAKNGGINWIIDKLRGVMKNSRSAQIGIAAMVSACDCATANNTVAIIVAGDMAREVSHTYRVDPRRTASLLDVFSCVFQGVIPYGAQLVAAATLANAATSTGQVFTAAGLIGSMWYCWILGVVGILSIFIPFADGVIRKNPWNWELDCAASEAAKKAAKGA